jgi:mxaJ protein
MTSTHRLLLPGLAALVAAAACGRPPEPPAPPAPRLLRVCADPNNLPFSNQRGEGFENRLAELTAEALGAELVYEWKPHRRGFIRTGLRAGACDVVIGMASEVDLALTTRPYYRSSYVVVRRPGGPAITSFDDPALAELRIGVQLVGDDYMNTPPAHALARRGHAHNLVGYTVYGDYRQDSPPAEVVRAVARGEIDLAIAWGPLAGYVARHSPEPLEVVPLAGPPDPADPPMAFDISMAVARGNHALRDELDAVLAARADEIAELLRAYGVPDA